MGNDMSKPKSIFKQKRSHLARICRADHGHSSVPASDSFFSDDGNFNDFRTDDKDPSIPCSMTLARSFLTGRKRSKSNVLYAPDEYPSEQKTFWKDYRVDNLRRPSNLSLALGQAVQEIVKVAFNGTLHMSPVIDTLSIGGSVLEIGCGSAKWSFNMSVAYPQSQITGLDLTNTFIKDSSPRNFKFRKSNSLTRLPFSDDTFDLVYSHGMMANTRKEFNDAIVKELIRIIKPGGHFELVENEIRGHKPGPRFTAIVNQVLTTLPNHDPEVSATLSKKLSSHPALLFVQTDYKNLRIGPHNGVAFSITRNMLQSVEGPVSKGLGLEKKEYMEYVEKCLEECCEHGTEHVVWVIWGQKSRLS